MTTFLKIGNKLVAKDGNIVKKGTIDLPVGYPRDIAMINGKALRTSTGDMILCEPEAWVMTIQTTAATEDYSLNIAVGSAIDLDVDWGDGATETLTTTGIKSHTYATAGTYYMSIRGTGTGLSIRQDGTASYANAQKVKATSAVRGITGIVNFLDSFRNTAIESIPADLFRYNTLVSGFRATFQGCTNLEGTIPADLFRYNVNVSTFGFFSTFEGCTNLKGTIPADLFRYNINVSTRGFQATFQDCTNLESIPADLFRYNVNVSTFGFTTTFFGCSNLEEAPDGLFKYNVLANNWQGCFLLCTKIKLNQYIFCDAGSEATRFVDQSINFQDFINRTSFTGVQGVAPELWLYDFVTGTPTKTRAFAGAGNSLTSLSNYNDIPNDWKT